MSGEKNNGKKFKSANGSGCLRVRGKVFWARWMHHGTVHERSTGIRTDTKDSKGKPCGRELALEKLSEFMEPFKLERDADVLAVIGSRVENGRQQAHDIRNNQAGIKELRMGRLAEVYRDSPRRNDISQQHLKANMAIINEFAKFIGMDRRVDSVTATETGRWASKLWASGISPHTYNGKVAVMKNVWKIIVPTTRLDANPFYDIKKKRNDVKLKRGITEEEYARILEVAGERYGGEIKMMVILGWNTGMRIGDCSTLSWNDIDFNKGFIRVVTEKTGQKISIPMLPDFREALLAHKKSQESEFSKAKEIGWNSYWESREAPTLKDRDANKVNETYIGYVCPRMAERHFRDRTLLNILMRKTFVKAGIETSTPSKGKNHSNGDVKSGIIARGVKARPIATFHSLRHGLASRLAQSGVPEIFAKELLGHRSGIVHDVYVHINEDYLMKEMQKMKSSNATK